jgi:hypothetical protein
LQISPPLTQLKEENLEEEKEETGQMGIRSTRKKRQLGPRGVNYFLCSNLLAK